MGLRALRALLYTMALRLGLHRLVHQLSMPRQAALDQGASGVMASLRLLASQDVLAGITSLPGTSELCVCVSRWTSCLV